MKRGICLALVGLFGSVSVYALDDAEFRESVKRIRETSQVIRNRTAQLGVKISSHDALNSFSEPSGDSSSSGEKKKKRHLLVVHNEGKRLRASAGKYLFGTLYHRLVVGGEPAPAIVLLSDDQGLFSGLKVLGKARPGGTEDRLAIDFDRIVTRQGTVIPVKAVAEDEAGAYGLEAQVFSSKALSVAGSIASSFISGAASLAQTQTPTAFGFNQVDRSGRNAILQGIAQTGADQSKRLIEDATKEKPVMVVDAGTPVTLYVDEEVRF